MGASCVLTSGDQLGGYVGHEPFERVPPVDNGPVAYGIDEPERVTIWRRSGQLHVICLALHIPKAPSGRRSEGSPRPSFHLHEARQIDNTYPPFPTDRDRRQSPVANKGTYLLAIDCEDLSGILD